MNPPPLTQSESEALNRRRRSRNRAIIIVLAGLAILFYAITIVKLTTV